MKKIIVSAALVSCSLLAFDMNGVVASVDKDKASDSVDKTKAVTAISQGDYAGATKSVDTDKASDSVDKEKLMKSLY